MRYNTFIWGQLGVSMPMLGTFMLCTKLVKRVRRNVYRDGKIDLYLDTLCNDYEITIAIEESSKVVRGAVVRGTATLVSAETRVETVEELKKVLEDLGIKCEG